jgi:hypothetical protein
MRNVHNHDGSPSSSPLLPEWKCFSCTRILDKAHGSNNADVLDSEHKLETVKSIDPTQLE